VLPDGANWCTPEVDSLLGVVSFDAINPPDRGQQLSLTDYRTMNNAVIAASKVSLVARDSAVQAQADRGGSTIQLFDPDEVKRELEAAA